MANPYDFTSGYLKAKEQKDTKAYRDDYIALQREEMGLKKPYWEAQTQEASARAGLIGEQAKTARFDRNLSLGIAKNTYERRKSQGLSTTGYDFFLNDLGDSVYGMEISGVKPPDYSLTQPAQADDPNNLGGGLKLRQFRDGTRGGVGQAVDDEDAALNANGMQDRGISGPVAGTSINNQAPVNQTATANPPAAEPVTNADPSAAAQGQRTKGPFATLAENDPGTAKQLYDDTFKKTSNFRNLSRTLMDLQDFDFIKGKITSKGMLENVQALKKMQQEGFFSAVNEAITGDPKKALDLYREFGDDKAEQVKSMTTYDIIEDVPNAKIKDKRKGVLITYDDGTTLKVDPRKLIMDAVTIKEFLDYEKGIKKDLREGEDQDLNRAQTERLRTDALNDKRDQQKQRLEESVRGRIMNEFKGEFSRMYKTYLDPNSPNFIPDENAKQRKGDEIDAGLRPAQNIAMGNVALGNYNIDASLAIQAAGQASDPKFLADPNNFELGPNGKPVTKEAYGQLYARTRAGVWIPVGLAK